MSRFQRWLSVGALLVGAACSDSQTAPVSSIPPSGLSGVETAEVSLATPHTDDGAVIMTLRGPDLSTISAASSGYLIYSRLLDSGEAHVLVVGNLVAGPIVRIEFTKPHPASAYAATIDQVVSRSDSILSLQGYQLSISAH